MNPQNRFIFQAAPGVLARLILALAASAALAAPPAPSPTDASRQITIGVGAVSASVDAEILPLPEEDTLDNAGLFIGVGEFDARANLSKLRYTPDDAVALAHVFVIERGLIPPARARLALGGAPESEA